MKDKLKTRFNELKHDRFVQGVAFGTVFATTGSVIAMKLLEANFSDKTTLQVPDHLVDHILATGLPVLVTRRTDGVQLSLGPS